MGHLSLAELAGFMSGMGQASPLQLQRTGKSYEATQARWAEQQANYNDYVTAAKGGSLPSGVRTFNDYMRYQRRLEAQTKGATVPDTSPYMSARERLRQRREAFDRRREERRQASTSRRKRASDRAKEARVAKKKDLCAQIGGTWEPGRGCRMRRETTPTPTPRVPVRDKPYLYVTPPGGTAYGVGPGLPSGIQRAPSWAAQNRQYTQSGGMRTYTGPGALPGIATGLMGLG